MSILVNTVLLTVVFFSFPSVQVTSVTSKEIRLHRDADDESTEAAVTDATPGAVDKTTRRGFFGSIKNVIINIENKINNALDNVKETIEMVKEKVSDSISVMQNGITNIFDMIVDLFKKEKIGEVLKVVDSVACIEEKFLESRHVILRLPPLVISYLAIGLVDNQTLLESCAIVIEYSSYASKYLKSCIISNDTIYKDTGVMLKDAGNMIDKYCYDLQFRDEIRQGIVAGLQEKYPCFKKYAQELVSRNLLSPVLKGRNRKKRSSLNDELFARDLLSPAVEERKQIKRSIADKIGDVCDTMQKVTHCTKKANNNMAAAAKLKTFEKQLESNVSGIVDRFCDKHKRSMPSVEVTVPTTVTLPSDITEKEIRSTAVLESSVPILRYLSVIVLLV